MDKIQNIEEKSGYFNEALGDTSFLLAGLLQSLLKEYVVDWGDEKWIDDSLITKIELQKNKMIIWGVMIWGRDNTTEQWTDPFSFEMELLIEKLDFKRLTFCSVIRIELKYPIRNLETSVIIGIPRKESGSTY